MSKIEFSEVESHYWEPLKWSPEMKSYKKLWDSVYQCARRDKEIYWWENYARFPETLCPEYRVWYWRTFGHWWWKARMALWWSVPVQAIITGGHAVKEKYEVSWDTSWRTRYVKKGFWNWFGKTLHERWSDLLYDWVGVGRWHTLHWEYCPECGFRYDFISTFDSDWYKCTEAGSYSTMDGTVHWFEGFWNCPRCLRRWCYGDSS